MHIKKTNFNKKRYLTNILEENIMTIRRNLIKESHDDVIKILVRCRIKIEDKEDPTVLDILTGMRAQNGIVTVRQTRPVSEIVSVEGHRWIEMNVSYLPEVIKQKDVFITVLETLKRVKGVSMIKAIEHEDDIINAKLERKPIIL